ncbi:hypothetical protein Q1695_002818 [Nippostrongylus brasiliensis]|nr:hypothetical protein Q1695_002818 [Nippostrongylus brasiliensis]
MPAAVRYDWICISAGCILTYLFYLIGIIASLITNCNKGRAKSVASPEGTPTPESSGSSSKKGKETSGKHISNGPSGTARKKKSRAEEKHVTAAETTKAGEGNETSAVRPLEEGKEDEGELKGETTDFCNLPVKKVTEGDGPYEDVNLVEAQEPDAIKAQLAADPMKASFKASGGQSTHALLNCGEARIVFKVMCSNNALFRIMPVYGFVDSYASVDVHVARLNGPAKEDKMVIHWAAATADETDAKEAFQKSEASAQQITIPLIATGTPAPVKKPPATAPPAGEKPIKAAAAAAKTTPSPAGKPTPGTGAQTAAQAAKPSTPASTTPAARTKPSTPSPTVPAPAATKPSTPATTAPAQATGKPSPSTPTARSKPSVPAAKQAGKPSAPPSPAERKSPSTPASPAGTKPSTPSPTTSAPRNKESSKPAAAAAAETKVNQEPSTPARTKPSAPATTAKVVKPTPAAGEKGASPDAKPKTPPPPKK